MASSDLVFQVRAQTSGAVSGFKRLAASIKPVAKDADAASKSLDKINKNKVSVKVEDKQLKAMAKEVARLQDEMRKAITLDVNADTRDFQRKIRGLQASMRTLAKSSVTPTIKTSGFARVSSVLKGVATQVGSFGASVGSAFKAIGVPVLGTALAGITALGVGFAATAVKALSLADSMERTQLQMNSFIRNTDKTNALLKQIQAFADTTPFEFPELAQASRLLLGLGFTTTKIIPQLKKIGDVAAQSGASVADLTLIYSQMVSAGRLNAGDMNQLVNAGVNAWPLLAKSMGKTVAQVRDLSEAGKIGAKEIQKFWDVLASGAAGSTAALAGTLSGMVSTLKDTATGVLRDIGTALLPFAKVLIPQLTKATKGLGDKIVSALPGFIDLVANAAKSLIDFGGSMLVGMKSVTVGLLQGLASLQSSLAGLLINLGTVLSILPGFESFGTGLVSAGTDMKIAAATTAAAALKAGTNWDIWIAKYNAGAKKAKTAIEGAQIAATFVIKAGKVQADVDRLTTRLNKLKSMKLTPEVKLKIDQAEAALERNQQSLRLMNKYVAKPTLLAKDLASGKVKFVKGKLVEVDGFTADPTIRLNDKASHPLDKFQADLAGTKDKNVNLTVKVRYDTSARPPAFAGIGDNSNAFKPRTTATTQAAATQVQVYVRDEKLSDLVDLRVNGQVARAARVVKRQERIAL